MTYNEYKEQITQEINEFVNKNCIWAFSKEQLTESLQEKNITLDDFNKNYVGFFGGGAIRKNKIKEYESICEKQNNQLKELMQNYDFAYNAFYYELNNHEYVYTLDAKDTFNSLGLSSSDVANNQTLNKAFCEAANKIISEY